MDSLSVNSLCHLYHHQFLLINFRQMPNHSPRKSRVVLLEINFGDQHVHDRHIPRDERQVRDRHLVSNQILLLREHVVQYLEHPLDLIVVPLNCAWDLLGVESLEPRRLAEVWTGPPAQGCGKCIVEGCLRTLDLRPGMRATGARCTYPGRCWTVYDPCHTCRPDISRSRESP